MVVEVVAVRARSSIVPDPGAGFAFHGYDNPIRRSGQPGRTGTGRVDHGAGTRGSVRRPAARFETLATGSLGMVELAMTRRCRFIGQDPDEQTLAPGGAAM